MQVAANGTPVRTPWRSIRQGVVERSERRLDVGDALASPCETCRTSPCCTHLPLHTFPVTNLAELSYADYLLNFDRIRLAIARSGDWSVYYVEPCRFLDRATLGCTVHGTEHQPSICVHYNPYTCWYKRTLTSLVSDELLLVDRTRFDLLRSMLEFDDERTIVRSPTWGELADRFRDVADEESHGPEAPLIDDPVLAEWRSLALSDTGAADPVVGSPAEARQPLSEVGDPCDGCAAPCCDTITFPQGRPITAASADFLRFALGFPGVELFVSTDGWWLTVKTRCRHLANGRSAIYGQPERPLHCRYYDALKCTFRYEYGSPRPGSGVRVRLEELPALLTLVEVDGSGAIVGLPETEVVRAVIEAGWRAGSGLTPVRTTVSVGAVPVPPPRRRAAAGSVAAGAIAPNEQGPAASPPSPQR